LVFGVQVCAFFGAKLEAEWGLMQHKRRGGTGHTERADSLVFSSGTSRFCLDTRSERLWKEDQILKLSPKGFAVLRYLVERPQRLITKREMLDALWGDAHVGDAVLKTHLNQLRRVIQDDVRNPHLIETVPRRGYRFIAQVNRGAPLEPARPSTFPPPSSVAAPSVRSRESEALNDAEDSPAGERPPVLQTSLADAGKKPLIDEFSTSLRMRADSSPFRRSAGHMLSQLEARFGSHCLPAEFAETLGVLTAGHPEFAARVLDHLINRLILRDIDGRWQLVSGASAARQCVVDAATALIERDVERLDSRERCILEAASVAGMKFEASVIADAIAQDASRVEHTCRRWSAQGRFVRLDGIAYRSSGVLVHHFAFLHRQHREVLQASCDPTRRVDLERRIVAEEKRRGTHQGRPLLPWPSRS
jgi:DNA-binding winged helix-turn-helix (wHTH) protein